MTVFIARSSLILSTLVFSLLFVQLGHAQGDSPDRRSQQWNEERAIVRSCPQELEVVPPTAEELGVEGLWVQSLNEALGLAEQPETYWHLSHVMSAPLNWPGPTLPFKDHTLDLTGFTLMRTYLRNVAPMAGPIHSVQGLQIWQRGKHRAFIEFDMLLSLHRSGQAQSARIAAFRELGELGSWGQGMEQNFLIKRINGSVRNRILTERRLDSVLLEIADLLVEDGLKIPTSFSPRKAHSEFLDFSSGFSAYRSIGLSTGSPDPSIDFAMDFDGTRSLLLSTSNLFPAGAEGASARFTLIEILDALQDSGRIRNLFLATSQVNGETRFGFSLWLSPENSDESRQRVGRTITLYFSKPLAH